MVIIFDRMMKRKRKKMPKKRKKGKRTGNLF